MHYFLKTYGGTDWLWPLFATLPHIMVITIPADMCEIETDDQAACMARVQR
jgi:hypothetical protein